MSFLSTVAVECEGLGRGRNVRVFDRYGLRILCSFRTCGKIPESVPAEVAHAKVRCIFANAELPVFDMFISEL